MAFWTCPQDSFRRRSNRRQVWRFRGLRKVVAKEEGNPLPFPVLSLVSPTQNLKDSARPNLQSPTYGDCMEDKGEPLGMTVGNQCWGGREGN